MRCFVRRTLVAAIAAAAAAIAWPAIGRLDAAAPFAVSIETPAWIESGHVELEYALIDGTARAVDAVFEYSRDAGATWAAATEGIGSGGTRGLASRPPPGARHRFVWNTIADIGVELVPDVRLRVTAATAPAGGGAGPAAQPLTVATSAFVLNNDEARNPVFLARGPYLQNITSSSVIVIWTTTAGADGEVEWGETPALGRVTAGGAGGRRQEVLLSGLDPARDYYYRVTARGAPLSPVERFRTPPLPGQAGPFTFIAFGDSGKGNAGQWDVAQSMELAGADFAIHTGDIVYQDGEQSDYDAKFFSPYRKLLARTPIFPALGNHDVGSAGGQAFIDNFVLPTQASGSERYYTFTYGNAQLFCLDSSWPWLMLPGLPQRAWFVNELARSTATWKLVYFHHPPYSSGGHGSDLMIRRFVCPFIERNRVDVVFNGHDHHYERTSPRRDYAQTPRGTVYIVTGAGGAISSSPRPPSSFTAHSANEHHFTRVTVNGNTLRAEAVRTDGTVIDAVDLEK